MASRPPIYPLPPFHTPLQDPPGRSASMVPQPDHGEKSYRGSGRLAGKVAIITGADSGIGRAVAIAFAREGADVVVSYLNEHDDAAETQNWIEEAGQNALVIPGDISDPSHAGNIVARTIGTFGRIDILVNNAAYQNPSDAVEDITVEDWKRHFDVNIHAIFYMIKAALPGLNAGASIINTASINADQPPQKQLAYSATKAAITNFTAGLAQSLAPRGIRVNAVLPGPIWTPLIPSTMAADEVENFGKQVPFQRPGQPAELASAYVMLASDESSYTSGAAISVAGGAAIL